MLEFHQPVWGLAAKNESLTVVSADRDRIVAQRDNGKTVEVKAKHASSFGVFERNEIEVAPGDKLLLQANWKDKSFRATNGELVTVAAVENRRIGLDDGRLLPANYRRYRYGYAITAHKSQGKTVDVQIISADHMRRDLFYVAVTRGREQIRVITSNRAALKESIGVSGDRQSAIELARKAR